jgi:NMT1 family protein
MTCSRRIVAPLWLLCTVLVLSACNWGREEIRVYPRGYQAFEPTEMRRVFDEQSSLSIVAASVPEGVSCLDALTSDLADICMEDNSAAFVTGVRAVLPIHQSVLHVFIRDRFEPEEPSQPLKGATIHVVDSVNAGLELLHFLTTRQGLDPGDYTVATPLSGEEADVIFYLAPIDPLSTQVRRPGYKMISMDKRLSPESQFTEEWLRHTIRDMEPVVIPAHTYDIPGNEEPVLTLAVDALLLARKGLGEEAVYEFVKTLVQQKPRFTGVAPHIFAGISEAVDPLDLNFPLHKGTRRYLERNDPSLVERYAETVSMVAYITVLLLSGMVGFARWRARRKKDRIDVFYVRVMDIQQRARGEDAQQLLQELYELEREAFASLIGEKLAADESFRIFTDLVDRVREDLRAGS